MGSNISQVDSNLNDRRNSVRKIGYQGIKSVDLKFSCIISSIPLFLSKFPNLNFEIKWYFLYIYTHIDSINKFNFIRKWTLLWIQSTRLNILIGNVTWKYLRNEMLIDPIAPIFRTNEERKIVRRIVKLLGEEIVFSSLNGESRFQWKRVTCV